MSFALNITDAQTCAAQELSAAKTAALSGLNAALAVAAEAITGTVPMAEQVSWPVKADAARAFVAGTASPEQEAQLQAEASLTGETLAVLAASIAANAAAYGAAAGQITGLRRATTTAISAATTPEEVQTAMTALHQALNA